MRTIAIIAILSTLLTTAGCEGTVTTISGDAAPDPDGSSPDAAPGLDAQTPPDAGPPDAGPPDAEPPDARPPDAEPPDAEPPDARPPDAPPPSTADFRETSGVVVMEAENFSNHTGGWMTEGHPDTSGGQLMRALNSRDSRGRIEFSVVFERAGWYRVWVRSNSTSHDDNDCYVFLDGGSGSARTGSGWTEVAGVKTDRRSWSGWDSIVKSGTSLPLDAILGGTFVYVLGAGEHVFAIGSRSVNFRIDKIVLVHQDDASGPSGLGPAETTNTL